MALLQYARDRIITVFGVPPAKVGIIETGNIGTGTGESQDKNFTKVINGTCSVVENAFNKNLGRSGFEEVFEFVREDHEDKQKRAEIEDKQLRNGTTFINEVRSGYGLDPVEWGNVPMNYSQFALAASPEQLDESKLIQPIEQVKMYKRALSLERVGKEYGF